MWPACSACSWVVARLPIDTRGVLGAGRRLAESMEAAALVRVRVSFALLAVGMLIVLLGFAPLTSGVLGTHLDPVVGSIGAWSWAWPFGLVLCFLSVSPLDARL